MNRRHIVLPVIAVILTSCSLIPQDLADARTAYTVEAIKYGEALDMLRTVRSACTNYNSADPCSCVMSHDAWLAFVAEAEQLRAVDDDLYSLLERWTDTNQKPPRYDAVWRDWSSRVGAIVALAQRLSTKQANCVTIGD